MATNPLKNCLTCHWAEHFPANGEPSKYLCTRVESKFIGKYFWENDSLNPEDMEIERNFVCYVEEHDAKDEDETV